MKSCQSIVVEDISAQFFDHSEISLQLFNALFLEFVHHDLVAQFHEYVVVHDIFHLVVSWDLEHLDQAPAEWLIAYFLLFIYKFFLVLISENHQTASQIIVGISDA